MRRSALLGGTILGPAGMSPLPPTTTSAAPEGWPEKELTLDDVREAIRTLEMRGPTPSVIVTGGDVPNGLEVSAGDVAFVTLSRDGLERLVAFASEADPYVRSDPTRAGFASMHGLPIVDLDALEKSGSPRGRTLATYYRAAILGYRRGLES